jgi:aminoglycoside/choline kinase family phosphotransferase
VRDAKIAQFTAEGNSGSAVFSSSDSRLDDLRQWVSGRLGVRDVALERASEDASFRRYFRIRIDDASWIAMDAPPDREDSRPFVKVAHLMREAGIHVPRIIEQDLARGFLLLSDLGTTT